jgi:hypothetical protein
MEGTCEYIDCLESSHEILNLECQGYNRSGLLKTIGRQQIR